MYVALKLNQIYDMPILFNPPRRVLLDLERSLPRPIKKRFVSKCRFQVITVFKCDGGAIPYLSPLTY